MPNTSTIAFFLLAGYVVFITIRGELPAYLCVLGLGSNCQPCALAQTVSSTSGSGTQGSSSIQGSSTKTGPVSSTSPISSGISSPINTNSSICPPGLLYDPISGGCITTGFGFGSPSGEGPSSGTDPCISDPESCGFSNNSGNGSDPGNYGDSSDLSLGF